MMPSVFIKRIRPFIPIITNDYRKAFVSSLTVPAFHKENEEERNKTILTQKSLTYFKNLGIQDEEVICSIIKRELFLEEFSKHELDNTAEDYIKSEIAKEIEKLKSRKFILENEIIESEKEISMHKEYAEKILEEEEEAKKKLRIEKESVEIEKQNEIKILVEKIKEKESVEEQLKKFNEEQSKFSKEKTIELKNVILDEVNQSIIILENSEKPLLDIIDTRLNNYKWRLSLILVAYFFLMATLIYLFAWSVMAPFTYLLSLFGVICATLYFMITGKSINPFEHFGIKKTHIIKQVYSVFNFDNEYLNSQRSRKIELEKEINELSSKNDK